MTFYFRRSANFGPVRLNFSKSGVGVSAGVRGARISTGPRGTYITAGRGGFSYRQRIGAPARHPSRPAPATASSAAPGAIPTADVADLVDTTSESVLAEINTAAARMAVAPWAAAAVALIAVFTLSIPWLAALAVLGGGWWVHRLHRRDLARRTTLLQYELDPEAQQRFNALSSAVAALAGAARVWRVEARQYTLEWKRNSGATSLIRRSSIAVGQQAPPRLKLSLPVQAISAGDLRLFFLPDRLFVYQRGRYGSVAYGDLRVEQRPVRFIELDAVPRDAAVVGQTWLYVRRDGGPDRRFRDNRQLPVVLYAQLELTSPSGLDVVLQVSNAGVAQPFAALFAPPHQRPTEQPRSEQSSSGGSRPRPPSPPAPASRSAHEVLGVTPGATPEEISTAYRHMAQQYHPDKVASLAPEFRELAERRMKEINAAYAALRRSAAPPPDPAPPASNGSVQRPKAGTERDDGNFNGSSSASGPAPSGTVGHAPAVDLTGIIGHAKAVERLRVAIAAASQRGDVLPHVLIDGPADLGANQFAPSIARAIGRNLVELNGRDLQGKADLASALTSVEQGDVLAILDIDGLRPWAIRQLASAMEHFQVEFTLGKGPDAQTLTLPLKRFTVVATTARLAHVAPELREHFDLGLHLEQYGEQDITTVLLRYAEAEGIRLEHGAAEEIANRSGGSVRDGQRLLRFARDYAQTQSIPLDAACVRQAAALLRSG